MRLPDDGDLNGSASGGDPADGGHGGGETDGGDSGIEPLTPDRAFELLADGERRRALATLRATDGAMDLHELAVATVARVDEVDPPEVSADRRDRAAAQLHHVHLPKLADAGVVEYDTVENRVDVTDRVKKLDPYFEIVEE